MATKRYPMTKAECEQRISKAEEHWGPNRATPGQLGYRNGAARECDGLVAFSFVASPRSVDAYREIPYC